MPGHRVSAFGSLRIEWDERVLEPRPWTTVQSTWAGELAEVVPAGPLLELCAGAGQIGLLAAVLSERALVQVERDEVAADFARKNAAAAGLGHLVEVRTAPLQSALRPDERFPLVLADPPYLRHAETDRFPLDPPAAIDGGDDGLDVVRACLAVAAAHLAEDGAVLLQVAGPRQADELGGLGSGFHVVEVREHDEERAVALLRRE
jgi:methylase of polypeptide subunit release factors